MNRLTFDSNFCDISQCRELPCPHGGSCTQRKVWEKLKAYEDTGLTPKLVQETAEFAIWIHENGLEKIKEWVKADAEGRLVVLPSDKALTNADRMRAATNQQLAKLLYDNQKELCKMLYKKLGFEDELNFSEDYSDILAWLNAPSKEAKAALEAMKDE